MMSTFIVGMFVVFFLSLFNSIYQGVIVAKLPFEPFGLIYPLTHKGILSNDPTDCSFIFLYILSNFCMRPILQKAMGFAPPRNSNEFMNFFGRIDGGLFDKIMFIFISSKRLPGGSSQLFYNLSDVLRIHCFIT